MYASQIIEAITSGFYPQPPLFDPIPLNLSAYYENHWHKIIQLSNVATSEFKQGTIEISVLNTLAKQDNPISVGAIAAIIKEDEYEVEELLETWYEFLNRQIIVKDICYSLYHSNFRKWLAKKF